MANYIEHYKQRRPTLLSTGEVGLSAYICPKDVPTAVIRFLQSEHRISISEWIELCMNLFRNVIVNADSWIIKNAF